MNNDRTNEQGDVTKMYYIIDNGDTTVITDIIGLTDSIEAESSDFTFHTNEADKPEWKITLTWLTEEEYNNLPEAY